MIGRQGLTQSRLLEAFAAAGAHSPTSHLTTGNVLFTATVDGPSVLQTRVEDRIAEILGRREAVFIRALDTLRAYQAADPFATFADTDIYERIVVFTGQPVSGVRLPIVSPRGDTEIFATTGSDLFAITRRIGGRPGTPGSIVEKTLGRAATTRNWNTVEHLLRRSSARSAAATNRGT